MAGCVGSGYCCWKAPCGEAMKVHPGLRGGPCPELRWNGERHLCGLIVDAGQERSQQLMGSLAVGEGCCSPLNSWRRGALRDRTEKRG